MLSLFLYVSYDALIAAGGLYTVHQSLLGKLHVGDGRWLSGCLDGLDKDIKGKQKAVLC